MLWLNYPNNPTGAVADIDFFEEAVRFAKKYDIAICHDGPYSEVAYDGYKPVSFLQAEGAKDVGIEFHSLSKSYNMTGWRIGMAVGNPTLIDALMRVKSNIDSGIPQAIQRMAIAALEGPQDCIDEHNAIYQRRRDKLVEALRTIGLRVQPPKASLYVWAHVPDGFTSAEFAARLIDDIGVVVTPGTGYGQVGEGYVRLSLTMPDERARRGRAANRSGAGAESRRPAPRTRRHGASLARPSGRRGPRTGPAAFGTMLLYERPADPHPFHGRARRARLPRRASSAKSRRGGLERRGLARRAGAAGAHGRRRRWSAARSSASIRRIRRCTSARASSTRS